MTSRTLERRNTTFNLLFLGGLVDDRKERKWLTEGEKEDKNKQMKWEKIEAKGNPETKSVNSKRKQSR